MPRSGSRLRRPRQLRGDPGFRSCTFGSCGVSTLSRSSRPGSTALFSSPLRAARPWASTTCGRASGRRRMGTSVEQIDEVYGHLVKSSDDAIRERLDLFAARAEGAVRWGARRLTVARLEVDSACHKGDGVNGEGRAAVAVIPQVRWMNAARPSPTGTPQVFYQATRMPAVALPRQHGSCGFPRPRREPARMAACPDSGGVWARIGPRRLLAS